MASPQHATAPATTEAAPHAPLRVGCVSYLNAKPLIDGLDAAGAAVRYDVPGRLLATLEQRAVDIALCPVIDFFRCPSPLVIVPAGGIGCAGPTLTVRLFSRVPLERVTAIHGDRDSHTSIVLLRLLMAERFGRVVDVIPFHASDAASAGESSPEAMLLIGDKVVTAAPDERDYPYTLDLGEAWHALTGLPFVFAVWLARRDTPLGDWPAVLDRQRRVNQHRLETIVQQHAPRHGWPIDLARRYLTEILQYGIGADELRAIEHFAALAAKHELIAPPRPLDVISFADGED